MGGEEHSDDLKNSIEDFLPFAVAFENMFDNCYKTGEKLRLGCVEVFGKWAPALRTKWYELPENARTQDAQEPIHKCVQIPPGIRKELTGRMQSKTKDQEGNISEGICLECSEQTEGNSSYCSSKCYRKSGEIQVCTCGSTNFSTSRVTFPMDFVHHHLRGKTSVNVDCIDCKQRIMTKCADMTCAMWARGLKRQAPEDHIPEWTKRTKV